MRTIRYRSRGQDVHFLEELLTQLGYSVFVSNYFGLDTDAAVKDFQKKNRLVVDGIVGPKTWSVLIEKKQSFLDHNTKLLSEKDLKDLAIKYDLELAAVKAVNEIESRGKGFLSDGRPKILFEGHIFWRELTNRGLDPKQLSNAGNADVLYKKWTRTHYRGGTGEYERLQKATSIRNDERVRNAAHASASWGAFQIMGFHYKSLGYASIDDFVKKMHQHEQAHLEAFGKFLAVNTFSGKSLIHWLKVKNWAKFARAYNGPGYKTHNYDGRLKKAYERYSR